MPVLLPERLTFELRQRALCRQGQSRAARSQLYTVVGSFLIGQERAGVDYVAMVRRGSHELLFYIISEDK